MSGREINVVELDKPEMNGSHKDVEEQPKKKENVEQSKAGRTFAIISYVAGIAGLPLSIITFGIYLFINVPALILGCMAIKKTTTKKDKARKGITMNIIGIVLDAIMCVIFFVLIILLATGIIESV